MYNEELITDVREGNIWIFGQCNDVKTFTNNKGRFGSIECCLNKEGIANIFRTPKFKDMGFPITYDSWEGNHIVQTKDGEVQFNKYEIGIPYTDSNKTQYAPFIKTVWEIFEGFTRKYIDGTKLAHGYQVMIDHPSQRDFK